MTDADEPAGPQFRLRGTIGWTEWNVPLAQGETRIGRTAENDIVLAVRGVSRSHARLTVLGERISIEDLSSRNGVIVNGAAVTRAELKDGDEIRLGPLTLRLERHVGGPPAIAETLALAGAAPAWTATPAAGRQAGLTAAAMLGAGCFVAQQVAGKAVRDALFLSHIDVERLPLMLMASALASGLAVLGLSRALSLSSPSRLVPLAAGVSAVLLVGEWWLSRSWPRLTALAVYLHLAVFGATLISGFWSLINEWLEPRAAKRTLGRIGLGASLGGLAGGLVAWRAASLLTARAMLLVMAGLNLLGLLGLLRLRSTSRERDAVERAPGPTPLLESARLLRQVPYLRDVAGIVGLGAVIEAFLDYNLKASAVATFRTGGELLGFFAAFYTGAGLLALLLQGSLSRRSLESLGVAGSVSLLPAGVGVGSLIGLVSPSLASAALGRGCQVVLQNSVFRSGYELLFTAIPIGRKRPTKMLVDVGFEKLGGLLGGALVLGLVSLTPQAAPRLLFALSVVGALAALLLSRGLQRGYRAALEDKLRDEASHLRPDEAIDSTTGAALIQTSLFPADVPFAWRFAGADDPAGEASAGAERRDWEQDPVIREVAMLRRGDPAALRSALTSRARLPAVLAAHIVPLLAREDVRREAMLALRRLGDRCTGALVDGLLDPTQDVRVRRGLPRVLRWVRTQRVVDGLLAGLWDEDFEVRRECGRALVRVKRVSAALETPPAAIFNCVVQELRRGPIRTSADPLDARILDHVHTLLSLVLDPKPLWAAFQAVRARGVLTGTALEYLEIVLPVEVRAVLWPALGLGPASPRAPRSAQEITDELLRPLGARGARREAADRDEG